MANVGDVNSVLNGMTVDEYEMLLSASARLDQQDRGSSVASPDHMLEANGWRAVRDQSNGGQISN